MNLANDEGRGQLVFKHASSQQATLRLDFKFPLESTLLFRVRRVSICRSFALLPDIMPCLNAPQDFGVWIVESSRNLSLG